MTAREKTGVLLMAYGAARSLDEIPAYLADIRHGRPPEPALVQEIRARYEAMGGRSPLPELTAKQARALQAALGPGFEVGMGMRHSAPRIADALEQLLGDGCSTVVGVPLTPFASALSTGAYFAKLDEAAAGLGASGRIRRAGSFHDHPRLIAAYADRARACLDRFGGRFPRVLFTAHSLPARILRDGDPYPRQLSETAALVAKTLELEHWDFAYQSRGRTGEEWLGPDAGEIIDRLAGEGVRALLVSPIGFVSEHLETLYDDDVLYREAAERRGIRFERAAALNDHPAFIDALADAVHAASSEKGTFPAPHPYT
ncbi:MAG: ferrochelatase [Elusimicrobia bacterium]|nr:ferrochelatase [Elusimicrobiota bacterium]